MKHSISRFTICVWMAIAAPLLHAQHTLSAASLFSAGKAVSATCHEEERIFLNIVKDYPAPAKWSVVIVCDEPSWAALLRHMSTSDGRAPQPERTYGETAIATGLTYLRGNTLLYPDLGNTPEHTIAHELAHLVLHSDDEYRVDAQAEAWIAQQKRRPGTLVANSVQIAWSPAEPTTPVLVGWLSGFDALSSSPPR